MSLEANARTLNGRPFWERASIEVQGETEESNAKEREPGAPEPEAAPPIAQPSQAPRAKEAVPSERQKIQEVEQRWRGLQSRLLTLRHLKQDVEDIQTSHNGFSFNFRLYLEGDPVKAAKTLRKMDTNMLLGFFQRWTAQLIDINQQASAIFKAFSAYQSAYQALSAESQMVKSREYQSASDAIAEFQPAFDLTKESSPLYRTIQQQRYHIEDMVRSNRREDEEKARTGKRDDSSCALM